MTHTRAIIGVVLTVGLLGTLDAQQRKFYPDDPLRVDLDTMNVSEEPAEIELSDMFDRFGHIAADLGLPELTEAHNVNTLDSWFTNRHGVRRMSIDDLVPRSETRTRRKLTWVGKREIADAREDRFDPIQPRGVGRREHELHVVVGGPVGHLASLVGREVVEDEVEARWAWVGRANVLEEQQHFATSLASVAPHHESVVRDVVRREVLAGAIPLMRYQTVLGSPIATASGGCQLTT